MDILLTEQQKIHDGPIDEIEKAQTTFNFHNLEYRIFFKALTPLADLNSINATKIANTLKFKTTTWGNMNVYHGSKSGLQLYYKSLENNHLAVFSFGEFQLNRFICIFEGVVSL